jgi:hypothetical protein
MIRIPVQFNRVQLAVGKYHMLNHPGEEMVINLEGLAGLILLQA